MAVYPDISDYTDSVQNATRQVIDPILRTASPRLTKKGTPEMLSGGAAVVYPFQDAGNIYAVKCWLRDIGDLRDHYKRVEEFVRSSQSEYFVGFAYVEKGIIAKNEICPFLRMKWVGGKSLLEFVSTNVSDSSTLVLLAERYLAMSQRLHKLGVAHGDLQGSNIKVEGNGAAAVFKLIDYDTLIVPKSYGRKADALALPSYQHPKRGASRCYTGKEDYFSELVIYICLLAVAEKPSLWSKYPKGDSGLKDEDRHDKEMLFVKEDFIAAAPTEIFKELFELSPLLKRLTLILWNYTRAQSIEQLLPLEEVLKIARDFIGHPYQSSKASAFESLLNVSSGTGNAWLEYSAFASRPPDLPITRPPNLPITVTKYDATNTKTTDSFEALLRANAFVNKDTTESDLSNQISVPLPTFNVRRGGYFGTKYQLTIKPDSLSFVNLENQSEIIFDPAIHYLTLRNPWWSGSDDHIILTTPNSSRSERIAFTLPLLKASPYSPLVDWWKRKKQSRKP